MGFPLGLEIQDLNTEIKLLGQNGSITQECNEYQFGFNAPSYGGASGSPIFNDKGQLIGVLSSGVTKSQGFNYAIKAVHIKNLLQQINDYYEKIIIFINHSVVRLHKNPGTKYGMVVSP